MNATATKPVSRRRSATVQNWVQITAAAPELAATMEAYLAEVATTLAPRSVQALETTLRHFAIRVVEFDPACTKAAAVTAVHIADYRAWLIGRPQQQWDRRVSAKSLEYRTGILRFFFERIMAWGWADSPATTPIPRDRPTHRSSVDLKTRKPRGPAKSPQPAARAEPKAGQGRPVAEMCWEEIADSAPKMVATMRAYLDQLAVSSRPSTVAAASLALRHLAAHLITRDPPCVSVAAIERRHIESYKIALAARRGSSGERTLAKQTIRHNLGMLRTFFERVIDWDYPDAPRRVPIFFGDIPKADEPLPKFLDDPTAAKFMATLATDPNKRRRLMVELLARTGMRAGELGGLRDDAMYKLGDTYWLRIPIGKLHNDRTVPLHPMLVGLINDYQAWRGPSTTGLLVERDDHRPFDRRTIHRYVQAVARRAGVGHVHPHQLRHTLATQCLNRGMSLEAIAALLGHRSPRMTLVYARISDGVVADQYFNATRAVETEAITHTTNADDNSQAKLHRRLLGNGHCTRPLELDCRFQTICEGCGFFQTEPEFITILKRQRDDATNHADLTRTALYNELVRVIDAGETDSTS